MPLNQRSRRSFLAAGLALSGMALSADFGRPNSWIRSLLAWRRRRPDELTADEFRSLVGSRVELRAEDGRRYRAKVARVRESQVEPRVEQFSVVFETRLEEAAAGSTFRVQHDEMGVCELMLTPIVTRRKHIDYEAAFTRLRA